MNRSFQTHKQMIDYIKKMLSFEPNVSIIVKEDDLDEIISTIDINEVNYSLEKNPDNYIYLIDKFTNSNQYKPLIYIQSITWDNNHEIETTIKNDYIIVDYDIIDKSFLSKRYVDSIIADKELIFVNYEYEDWEKNEDNNCKVYENNDKNKDRFCNEYNGCEEVDTTTLDDIINEYILSDEEALIMCDYDTAMEIYEESGIQSNDCDYFSISFDNEYPYYLVYRSKDSFVVEFLTKLNGDLYLEYAGKNIIIFPEIMKEYKGITNLCREYDKLMILKDDNEDCSDCKDCEEEYYLKKYEDQ